MLAGASIGANLALRVAVREPESPFAVLLSPGYVYRGIGIRKAILAFDRPLILAAALDDPYALKSAEHVFPWLRHRESWFLKAISGHGVKMLEGKDNEKFVAELMKRIDEMVATKISAGSSGTPASP